MTIEQKVEKAKEIIMKEGVTDEDMKQDIYLAAITSRYVSEMNRKISKIIDREKKNIVITIKSNFDLEKMVLNKMAVEGLIEELDTIEKEIIKLKYFNEMNFSEISRKLTISRKDVENIHNEVIEKLRLNMFLKGYGEDLKNEYF